MSAPTTVEKYITPDGKLTHPGYVLLKALWDAGSTGVVDGDKVDITVSNGGLTWTVEPQVSAGLDVFTDLLNGVVPASGGGALNFLRADGTWATPSAGSVAWGSITGTLSAQTDLQTALDGKVDLAGDTMTGPLITAASASGGAGFRLPPGADPSAPVDGDVWGVALGMKARINGSTKFFAFTNTTQTFTSPQTFSQPVNFSQQPSVDFVIENRTSDPGSPVTGQIWLRSDL